MCRLSDLDGEPCFVGRLGGNASSSDSVLELLGRNLRKRFGLGAAPSCAVGAPFRLAMVNSDSGISYRPLPFRTLYMFLPACFHMLYTVYRDFPYRTTSPIWKV